MNDNHEVQQRAQKGKSNHRNPNPVRMESVKFRGETGADGEGLPGDLGGFSAWRIIMILVGGGDPAIGVSFARRRNEAWRYLDTLYLGWRFPKQRAEKAIVRVAEDYTFS